MLKRFKLQLRGQYVFFVMTELASKINKEIHSNRREEVCRCLLILFIFFFAEPLVGFVFAQPVCGRQSLTIKLLLRQLRTDKTVFRRRNIRMLLYYNYY